jgi:hypothetical protein
VCVCVCVFARLHIDVCINGGQDLLDFHPLPVREQ